MPLMPALGNKMKKLCIGLLLSTTLTACVSPLSTRSMANADDTGLGISYFLPKRELKITLDRKPVTTAEIARLEAQAGAARAALVEVENDLKTKKALLKIAELQLKAAEEVGLADGALNPLKAAVATAKYNERVAMRIVEERRAPAAAASERLHDAIAANAKNKSETESYQETIKVEISPYLPDTRHRFVAELNHSWARSDKWAITTTDAGLLQSANADPDGKLDDILVEAGKLAIQAFGGTGPIVGAATLPGLPKSLAGTDGAENAAQDGCLVSYHVEFHVDPAIMADRTNLAHALANICSAFHIEIAVPAMTSAAPKLTENVVSRGLAYRRQIPYTVVLSKHLGGITTFSKLKELHFKNMDGAKAPEVTDFAPVDSQVVLLPNGAPIDVVSFDASSTTAQIYKTTFQNGMLTMLDYTRPSEGAAIIGIPSRIISGAVSQIGELTTLRLKTTTDKLSAADEDVKLYDKYVETLKARQSYEEALEKFIADEKINDTDDQD